MGTLLAREIGMGHSRFGPEAEISTPQVQVLNVAV